MKLPKLLSVLASVLMLAASGAADAAAQAGAGAVVRGRVLAVGADSVAGLRVRASAGAFADSAEVGADGRFAIPVPGGAWGDSLELRVEAVDPAIRAFHPARVGVAAEDSALAHEIVLVPVAWTIPGGRYAGTEVEIRLDRAFGELCEGCHGAFYRWARARASGARMLAAWPGARFPLRVAFDREWSGEAITARDSASFWKAVGEMEDAFGEDLFRPAPFHEAVPREERGPEDAILVWVDPELSGYTGYGSAISTGGDITYGDLRLRRGALRDGQTTGVVVHELLHTLGFGHTCAWRSVLADARRCPSMRADEPTPEDVAYVQVASLVREMERAGPGRRGFEAALAAREPERAAPEPGILSAN